MIVIGLVIGMGIFGTPPEVAQKSGTVSVFFLAWILGAVISMVGALIFAEIGSRYPAAGGFYKIFSHCYHPAFAFMVNWITVISNAASTAGVAIMGAEYISPILFPNLDRIFATRAITIFSVLFLYLINMIGIKLSSKLLNVLMIVKIAMLLLLISAVFFVSGQHANDLNTTAPSTSQDISYFRQSFTYFTFAVSNDFRLPSSLIYSIKIHCSSI